MRQAFGEVGQQRALARLVLPEEMGAAGDVEQQTGIAAEAAGAAGLRAFLGEGAAQGIDRHPRRVAVAPAGDRLDEPPVGLRLDRDGEQVGHKGARIGQPQRRPQPGVARVAVDRGEPRAAVEPGDGGGGPRPPVLRRPRETIRGKLGEPQRDNAFHRSTPEARSESR